MNVWKLILYPVFLYLYTVHILRGLLLGIASSGGDVLVAFGSVILISSVSATIVSRYLPKGEKKIGMAAEILAFFFNWGLSIFVINYILRATIATALTDVTFFINFVLPLLWFTMILPYVLIYKIRRDATKQTPQVKVIAGPKR